MTFRLPELNDKEKLIEYVMEHYAHNEKSISASNKLTSTEYEEWVNKIHINVNIPDKEWGRSLTYLVFNDDKRLVGLLSIRYDLPEEMVMKIGHIGYGVRPSERRKGYATQMLKYALHECKKYGLKKAILGCYKENIGSARTIIKNNGKLIKENNVEVNISDYWNINLVNQIYEIEI